MAVLRGEVPGWGSTGGPEGPYGTRPGGAGGSYGTRAGGPHRTEPGAGSGAVPPAPERGREEGRGHGTDPVVRTAGAARAAELLGAADAVRGVGDVALPDAAGLAARLRRGLGAEFEPARARGTALKQGDAIELLRAYVAETADSPEDRAADSPGSP
ncbi:hypothetical protein ACHZ98_17930 [Streptomyces sp. MAR4 CNY-716]